MQSLGYEENQILKLSKEEVKEIFRYKTKLKKETLETFEAFLEQKRLFKIQQI